MKSLRDSIFCATGITDGDLVKGVKIKIIHTTQKL